MARDKLIEDLRCLSRRELRLTLAELDPGEREQVLELIDVRPKADDLHPPFETLVGLSPWLLKAIDRAKSDTPGEGAMTAAARDSFYDAIRALAKDRRPKPPVAPARGGALARLLGLRQTRRQAP